MKNNILIIDFENYNFSFENFNIIEVDSKNIDEKSFEKLDFIACIINALDFQKSFLLVKELKNFEMFSCVPMIITTIFYSKIFEIRTSFDDRIYYNQQDLIDEAYINKILNRQESCSLSHNLTVENLFITTKKYNSSLLSKSLSEIYLTGNRLEEAIKGIFSTIPLLCDSDITVLIVNNKMSTTAYIDAKETINRVNFDDFFKFCLHDNYQNFNFIDFKSVEKVFINKQIQETGSFNEKDFINSYFYSPVFDNKGNPIATLHFGNFANNYFSDDSFYEKAQDFAQKTGIIIEKILSFGNINREITDMKNLFSKFVPMEIIEEIVNQGQYKKKDERKTVAILFSDIRSFTNITESNKAEDVISFLNIYFNEMVKSIKKHGGYIDKFIGDAIVAVFDERNNENIADNALKAAISMLKNQQKIEVQSVKLPSIGFKIGIGLHLGEVIAGNIGSDRKMTYTVIGETTGIAEELESDTKKYTTDILLSRSLSESLDVMKKTIKSVGNDLFTVKEEFLNQDEQDG